MIEVDLGLVVGKDGATGGSTIKYYDIKDPDCPYQLFPTGGSITDSNSTITEIFNKRYSIYIPASTNKTGYLARKDLQPIKPGEILSIIDTGNTPCVVHGLCSYGSNMCVIGKDGRVDFKTAYFWLFSFSHNTSNNYFGENMALVVSE